jgi:2-methylcitrate dehydratase PrpD
MPAMTLASRIGTWIAQLDARSLPGAVVAKLKLAVTDTLAAMLAGSREDVVLRLLPCVGAMSGGDAVSVIGRSERVGTLGACLLNGTMAHACDYDDSSWLMWGHPSAPVLPAALAICEWKNLSGADLLVAFAAGIEVEKILGLGCQPDHYQRGYHPTGSLGVFGAAAASAQVLRLRPPQIEMAIGLAASRAAAIRENFGSMTKPLHVGFAARDGAEAAFMAGQGITSSPRALEGPMGFFHTLAPELADGDVDRLADALGHPFEVVDPGLSPKLYSCCSEAHAAVDAILDIRAQGVTAPDVVRIRCGVTPAADANLVFHDPQTPLQAKFSQEYCLAAALVRGKLGIGEFNFESVNDAAIRDVMRRIEARVHPDLSKTDSVAFSSPAIVEVETRDGRVHKRAVREMKGHPKNPLTASDIESKFRECAGSVLPAAKAREAYAKLTRLEQLESVRSLVEDLRMN